MMFKLTGLWQHAEFKKLWAGQAVSLISSQFMYIAMLVTAVDVLDATPFQMGIVTAMQGVPALFGLFIGSWTDRRRRLPIIVGVDLGRAALLLILPIAYLLDVLTIELIYFVAFGIA
ncbi:MAG: MFS transporter, partial [Dehalococcoidia bacterium]